MVDNPSTTRLSVDGGPPATHEVRRQRVRVPRESIALRLHTRGEPLGELALRHTERCLADIDHERVQIHETLHRRMGSDLSQHHAAERMADEDHRIDRVVEQRPNTLGIVNCRFRQTTWELNRHIGDSEVVKEGNHAAATQRACRRSRGPIRHSPWTRGLPRSTPANTRTRYRMPALEGSRPRHPTRTSLDDGERQARAGVADLGALHEVGQGVALEVGAHLVADADPHLLQHTVAFAVVVLVHQRGERPVHGSEDLGESDLLRRAREHVPAADAPLRPHESRALHREQDLLQVRLGERSALCDLLDGGRTVGAVQRERQQGPGCVVATGRDFHGPSMVAGRRGWPRHLVLTSQRTS